MVNIDNKNLIIGIVVVVLIFVLLGSFGYNGYGMMGGYNPAFMLLSWVFSIVIIIIIVAGIFWLYKNVDFNVRRKK